jgi:hypothetical protein
MNEQFQRAILEAAESLLIAASTDERLCSSLRLCAEQLLALTAEPDESVPPPVEQGRSQGGGEQPVVDSSPPAKPDPIDEPFNLATVRGRLSLKAEAARWAAERPRLIAEGADLNLEIRPQDHKFFRRAQEQGCFLWILAPKAQRVATPDKFTLVAAWYENLSQALGLLDQVSEESGWQADEITDLLELAAESQSALRVAVGECGFRDEDQQAAFNWLKGVADEHRILIRAGMKWDSPTDPSERAALADRIEEVRRRFEDRRAKGRKRKKLLAKVRHKASVLEEDTGESPETWGELMAVVDELVQAGLPPSDKQLREALLPVLDRLPGDMELPPGFRLAVREIEKFKQSRPVEEPPTRGKQRAAVVEDARKLLAGRSALLIGAEGRREAKEALEQALGLKEMIWITTNNHDWYLDFEPFVARTDVAVVLLAIRWSSHSFGEIRSLCERYGKPLVRLPAGYNPNQVAQQVVTQAGKRLAKQTEADG